MLKPLAFIAATLVSLNTFAMCPVTMTSEELVKSVEKDFSVRCGVIDTSQPDLFFCAKLEVPLVRGENRTQIDRNLFEIKAMTLELVDSVQNQGTVCAGAGKVIKHIEIQN
jgi:hypothetical protein